MSSDTDFKLGAMPASLFFGTKNKGQGHRNEN